MQQGLLPNSSGCCFPSVHFHRHSLPSTGRQLAATSCRLFLCAGPSSRRRWRRRQWSALPYVASSSGVLWWVDINRPDIVDQKTSSRWRPRKAPKQKHPSQEAEL